MQAMQHRATLVVTRPRGDVVTDFVESPAGRSKEALQSLHVLVGWKHGTGVNEGSEGERFFTALVEEMWRRNFGALYKGQPTEVVMEVMEQLLYGPGAGEGVAAGDGSGELFTSCM